MPSRAATDAIVAPATAVAPGARAVLRLSGPDLLAQADTFLPAGLPRPRGRREALHGHWQAWPGVRLEVSLLCFPGPASATGEDVLECHLLSAVPAVNALLAHFLAHGLRLAEPGEFTRRAFLHGRLDLTQAEAVLDLVEAQEAEAAAAAAARLAGSLHGSLAQTSEALAAARVELEAGLDFEEGDSQDLIPGEVDSLLAQAAQALSQACHFEARQQALGRDRWRIGLVGPANAGKTTLFRLLTGESEALVSATAGTTRDRLSGRWQPAVKQPPEALPWQLEDFPGLGGTAVDARDAAARARTQGDLAELDLQLYLLPPQLPAQALPPVVPEVATILVLSKGDLPARVEPTTLAALRRKLPHDTPMVRLAEGGREGREALEQATATILDGLAARRARQAQLSYRYGEAMAEALAAVQRAQAWAQEGGPQDLIAEELRLAQGSLAVLLGEQTPEALLDRLFASFCIGK